MMSHRWPALLVALVAACTNEESFTDARPGTDGFDVDASGVIDAAPTRAQRRLFLAQPVQTDIL